MPSGFTKIAGIITFVAAVLLIVFHIYCIHLGNWSLIVAAFCAFGSGYYGCKEIEEYVHSLNRFKDRTKVSVICELDDNSIIVKGIDKNFSVIPGNILINSHDGRTLLREKPENFPAAYAVRRGEDGRKELALIC